MKIQKIMLFTINYKNKKMMTNIKKINKLCKKIKLNYILRNDNIYYNNI